MGVADHCNACTDWPTVTNVGLQLVGDKICRRLLFLRLFVALVLYSGGRRWSSVSAANLLHPRLKERLHQQRGGRHHPARQHAVPVGHRGTPRSASQRHPVGLRQRRRHGRSFAGGRRRSGSDVSGLRRHEGTRTRQKFHCKTDYSPFFCILCLIWMVRPSVVIGSKVGLVLRR